MKKNKTLIWATIALLVVIALILIVQMSSGSMTSNGAYTQTDTSVVTPTPQGGAPSVTTTSKTSAVKKVSSSNVVQLTDKGFSPFIITINRGEGVEFLNASSKTMIIRSYDSNPANVYPGFEETGAPLGRGGKFYFGFTTPGDWAYYNLNSPNDKGVIIVQ